MCIEKTKRNTLKNMMLVFMKTMVNMIQRCMMKTRDNIFRWSSMKTIENMMMNMLLKGMMKTMENLMTIAIRNVAFSMWKSHILTEGGGDDGDW